MGSIVKQKRNIIGVMSRREDSSFVYSCTRCGMDFLSCQELETHFPTHNRPPSRNDNNAVHIVGSQFQNGSNNSSTAHSVSAQGEQRND